MPKKIVLQTSPRKTSVAAYIQSIDKTRRAEATTLLQLFKDTTGVKPKMWGDSIVGFGEYTYHRSNGDEGTYLATGFSIRKSGPTVYIMPGYNNYAALLKKLGVTYRLGSSCLYLKNLDGLHLPTLKKLIAAGLKDLQKTHTVVMK